MHVVLFQVVQQHTPRLHPKEPRLMRTRGVTAGACKFLAEAVTDERTVCVGSRAGRV